MAMEQDSSGSLFVRDRELQGKDSETIPGAQLTGQRVWIQLRGSCIETPITTVFSHLDSLGSAS